GDHVVAGVGTTTGDIVEGLFVARLQRRIIGGRSRELRQTIDQALQVGRGVATGNVDRNVDRVGSGVVVGNVTTVAIGNIDGKSIEFGSRGGGCDVDRVAAGEGQRAGRSGTGEREGDVVGG